MRYNLQSAASGLISTGIPFIFKGMINQYLTDKEFDIGKAVDWVRKDTDLINLFKQDGGDTTEAVIERIQHFVKDLDWLTADYFIDSCRDEHPDIASLFMGWPEGLEWLDRNIAKVKAEFFSLNNPPPQVKNPPTQERSSDVLPKSEPSEKTEDTKVPA